MSTLRQEPAATELNATQVVGSWPQSSLGCRYWPLVSRALCRGLAPPCPGAPEPAWTSQTQPCPPCTSPPMVLACLRMHCVLFVKVHSTVRFSSFQPFHCSSTALFLCMSHIANWTSRCKGHTRQCRADIASKRTRLGLVIRVDAVGHCLSCVQTHDVLLLEAPTCRLSAHVA